MKPIVLAFAIVLANAVTSGAFANTETGSQCAAPANAETCAAAPANAGVLLLATGACNNPERYRTCVDICQKRHEDCVQSGIARSQCTDEYVRCVGEGYGLGCWGIYCQ